MEMLKTANFVELNDKELNIIDGGADPLTIIGTGIAVVTFLYGVGYAIGKAIAHAGY